MVREKFERIGRVNVILTATPRVSSHFFKRALAFKSVFAGSDLAIPSGPKSFDRVVEKMIEPSAEAFGLLRLRSLK